MAGERRLTVLGVAHHRTPTKADRAQYRSLLKENSVIGLEAVGYREDFFNLISFAAPRVSHTAFARLIMRFRPDRDAHASWDTQYRLFELGGKGKYVIFPDLPEGHPLIEEGNQITSNKERLIDSIWKGNVNNTDQLTSKSQEWDRLSQQDALHLEQREQFTMNTLGKKLTELEEAGLTDSSVLLVAGAGHAKAYSELAKQAFSSANVVYEEGLAIPLDSELINAHRKEQTVTNELLPLRAMFEQMITSFLGYEIVSVYTKESYNELVRACRVTAETLSVEQIQAFCIGLKGQENEQEIAVKVRALIDEAGEGRRKVRVGLLAKGSIISQIDKYLKKHPQKVK